MSQGAAAGWAAPFPTLLHLVHQVARCARSLRRTLEALSARGRSYSEQALTHALKKLAKERKVRRVKAPKSSAASYLWKLPPHTRQTSNEEETEA